MANKILNSGLFNEQAYLARYPDVAAGWKGTAEEHFLQYGANEGRIGNTNFDVTYLRSTYADLSGMTAAQLYTWYNQYGYAENRVTSSALASFNAAKYLDDNADLGKGGVTANSALAHYLMFGVTEGRAAYNTSGVAYTVANGTVSTGTGGNEAGKETVLTTAQDILTGTAGADTFRAVAGAATGTQDQTTLNSSDIIDGAAGADTIVVNMTGSNYGGGARIKNIETLQIGTNQAAANFDYNVNQGSNEITEVTTIVADQINVGETLTVNNILKTGSAIPTLKWDNEAASTAGTFAANFRESAVSGDTEVKLVLDDVKALNADATTGRFNLGTGANASVETLRVVSQGSTTNTLNNSANNDGTAVDLVGASTDGVNDNGALKTVIVEGAQTFGKAADVVTDNTEANYGLVNRTARGADDLGTTTKATAANLVSLAATVTTLDASAATGDTNIRFTGRVDGAEVAVTYKGGKGNDYVEFQQGNVNATGGDGNDTFAFVNAQNNSTLTTADTIVGGAGTDTIQMGVNGVGSYNLETTEFNNKSGIDVLDLRGQTNTVKLSDAFVTGSDAGLTVRTDKIVQTSATNTANDSTYNTNNLQENQSVNTIDLTALAANRAVTVTGGSGSDRLLVNEVALNSSIVFDGGTNAGNNAAGTGATAGDYDTLTVVNSAVLSRGDLSNIKGIEGIVLTENVTGNSAFTIELTEAFMLANTASSNSGSTSIDDRILQIVTAAAANGTALTAADTVKIDVTDLFDSTTNALKTSLVGRQIDTNGAGATVSYVYKGTEYATIAALQAATNAAGGTFVSGADASRADVSGSGAAVTAGAAAGVTFTSGIGAQSTLGTNNNDVFTLTQADTVTGGNGTDTVTFNTGSAAANVVLGGTGADTVNLNVALTGTLNMAAGGTVAIATDLGGAFNFNTPTVTFGAATTVNVTAAQTGAITMENGAGHTLTSSVGGTYNLGTGGQTFTGSGATAFTATGGTGADSITGGAAADTIANLASGSANTAGDVLTGNGGADTFILRGDVASSSINAAYVAAPRVTDFVVGTDILSLSSTSTNYNNAATSFAAGIVAAATTAAGATAIQDVAQSAGAAAYVAGTDLIKLTTGVAATTNMTVQQIFDAAIGTSTVTGFVADTEVFVAVYDTTNARMLVGLVDAGAGVNTTVETGDTVTLVGTIDMTAANYAAFSNTSLAFVVA